MKNIYLVLLSLAFISFVSCSSAQANEKDKLLILGIEPTENSLLNQAKEGHLENVQLLLSAGISADSVDEKGYPVLIWAAAKGHAAVVDALLSAGADKDKKDKDGDTALLSAVKSKKLEAAKVLLSAGVNTNVIDKKGWTPLRLAIMDKSEDMVQALVQEGADINELSDHGNTILMKYMEVVTPEIARILVEASSLENLRDILNKDGENALTVAIMRDRSDVLSYIIEKGADINAQEWGAKKKLPLQKSLSFNAIKCFDLFMQRGVNISYRDKNGRTVMHDAAYYLKDKNYEIVQKLVAADADVNAKDNTGKTPLFSTVNGAFLNHKRVMQQKVIKELIEAGADVNAENKSGDTFLTFVLENKYKGYEDVVAMLEKAGAKGDPTLAAGCPRKNKLTKMDSGMTSFKDVAPLDFSKINSAGALINKAGNKLTVSLSNGTDFSNAQLANDFVLPIKDKKIFIADIEFRNNKEPIVAGSYSGASTFGKPFWGFAEVKVHNGEKGTVVDLGIREGTATIINLTEDWVCGTLNLRTKADSKIQSVIAGEFNVKLERSKW